MAELTLTSVSKSFGDVPAVSDVSMSVRDGEFVALLGPSGCGKSTLLRLLAGFEHPTTGQIAIGAQQVANAQSGQAVAPEDRNIGFVFQSYALWPHMNVRRNVGYPLEVRGIPRAERNRQIDEALLATALMPYAERMPADLSGGQRQRVALARCLLSDPTAVLLDEPLANLDVALRASMQDVFSDFHQRTDATMVYVTHDQAEAMAMADRIAVMDAGRIVQMDTPEQLYAQPRSRFVAGFIGEGSVLPVINPVPCADGMEVTLLGQRVVVNADCATPNLTCVRPENIIFGENGMLRACVERSIYTGGQYRLRLRTDSGSHLVARSLQRHVPGEQVGLSLTRPWAFANY